MIRVDRFGVFEQSFQATGTYSNPYREVDATAVLTRPDGSTWEIPLFWDGDRTWKIRVSPDVEGQWSYCVRAADSGLAAGSGSFECVPSNRHGSIVPMALYPHHFQYQNGTPFWWMGDTGWRSFATCPEKNLTRDTVCHYFDERAAQGFNYIHVEFMGGLGQDGQQKVMFSFPEETLNVSYFQEADYRLQYMNKKGIICGIVLAWANGAESWSAFTSDEARLRYARYMVARYSAFEVVYIVSGEWDLSGIETKPRYLAIGREIMRCDPHNRMRAIHPCRPRSSEEFVTEPWMSFGDYQQLYQAPPDREATAAERYSMRAHLLKPKVHGRPVVNAEFAYYLRDMSTDRNYWQRDVPGTDKEHSHTRESFRRAAWALAMAGGYFVAGFGTTYYGGWREAGPFDVDAPKNDVGEADLTNIRKFFTGLKWWTLQVQDALLKTDAGYGYCLADLDETYVAFTEGAREIELNLELLQGTRVSRYLHDEQTVAFRVRLYDPRTGEYRALPDHEGGEPIKLTLPDDQDWVVLVQRKDAE